jgi:hypothetical protein
MYEILAASGYTTVNTLGSGFSDTVGVAVDGGGNLYLTGIYSLVKLDYADAPVLSFVSTFKDVMSADSPRTVQVQNVGNEALTFTGLTFPADFPEQFGDVTDSCTASTPLGTGQQCNLNIDFIPQSVSYLSETVTLTDNALNVSGAQQSIGVSGTGIFPPPVATLSSSSLSFGNETVGATSASQSVTLTNTGGSPLLITSIGVAGRNASSFVFVNNCGTSLAIEASCTIHGHLTPATGGILTAIIIIRDNEGPSPESINLSGTGVNTTASLSTTALSFGGQEVGTTGLTQSVTLTNTGGGRLLIESIAETGAGASSFEFANSCGTSVAVGANCTIHGHFTPAATGPLTAAIAITDSAGVLPQIIKLSGTGTVPGASLSATSLTFGTQNLGTTGASQDVTLTNTGGATLVISSIAVTGADASSFVFGTLTSHPVPNGCKSELAAGANCLIHGHFTPTLTGPLTAAVTITDNATGSPQTITLTGTGH